MKMVSGGLDGQPPKREIARAAQRRGGCRSGAPNFEDLRYSPPLLVQPCPAPIAAFFTHLIPIPPRTRPPPPRGPGTHPNRTFSLPTPRTALATPSQTPACTLTNHASFFHSLRAGWVVLGSFGSFYTGVAEARISAIHFCFSSANLAACCATYLSWLK